jgi:hypothetical protein
LCFFFFGGIEVFADLADGCNVCKPISDGLNALLGCLKDDRRSLADRLRDRLGDLPYIWQNGFGFRIRYARGIRRGIRRLFRLRGRRGRRAGFGRRLCRWIRCWFI